MTLALFLYLLILTANLLIIGKRERTSLWTWQLPTVGHSAASRLDSIVARYQGIKYDIIRDGVVQEWLESGNEEEETLLPYLHRLKGRYDLSYVSVISDGSETYYGTDKILVLDRDYGERDGWYYEYRESEIAASAETGYYADYYGETGFAIYINIPHFDDSGRWLGLSGGGFFGDPLVELMQELESEWDMSFHLIRARGEPVYSTNREADRLGAMEGTDLVPPEVLEQIRRLKRDPRGHHLSPPERDETWYWGVYLPTWDSYLILEKSPEQIREALMPDLLSQGLLQSVLVSLLFLMVLLLFRHYDRKVKTRERKISVADAEKEACRPCSLIEEILYETPLISAGERAAVILHFEEKEAEVLSRPSELFLILFYLLRSALDMQEETDSLIILERVEKPILILEFLLSGGDKRFSGEDWKFIEIVSENLGISCREFTDSRDKYIIRLEFQI